MPEQVTPQDVQDLVVAGYAINWHWRKVFYALKDAILQTYGALDGYCLQEWWDEDWQDVDDDEDTNAVDYYARHRHILECWRLLDRRFHRPTDEFDYFNYNMQVGKTSPNFAEMLMRCFVGQAIAGKKKYGWQRFECEYSWRAFKRLMARFGHLLKVHSVLELKQ